MFKWDVHRDGWARRHPLREALLSSQRYGSTGQGTTQSCDAVPFQTHTLSWHGASRKERHDQQNTPVESEPPIIVDTKPPPALKWSPQNRNQGQWHVRQEL